MHRRTSGSLRGNSAGRADGARPTCTVPGGRMAARARFGDLHGQRADADVVHHRAGDRARTGAARPACGRGPGRRTAPGAPAGRRRPRWHRARARSGSRQRRSAAAPARPRSARPRRPARCGPASRRWRRRSRATKRLAGGRRTPRAGRACSSRPARITAIRSAMLMASVWSWVTVEQRQAEPALQLADLAAHVQARAARRGRRAARPAGRAAGSVTMARPSATRCCCPPDSWLGRRSGERGHLHRLQRRGHAGADVAARHAAAPADRRRRSRPRSCSGTARSSGTPCRPGRRPGGRWSTGCPSNRIRPTPAA